VFGGEFAVRCHDGDDDDNDDDDDTENHRTKTKIAGCDGSCLLASSDDVGQLHPVLTKTLPSLSSSLSSSSSSSQAAVVSVIIHDATLVQLIALVLVLGTILKITWSRGKTKYSNDGSSTTTPPPPPPTTATTYHRARKTPIPPLPLQGGAVHDLENPTTTTTTATSTSTTTMVCKIVPLGGPPSPSWYRHLLTTFHLLPPIESSTTRLTVPRALASILLR